MNLTPLTRLTTLGRKVLDTRVGTRPVICLYDPRGWYGPEKAFDRMSFAGSLYDGSWTEGSIWTFAAKGKEPAVKWILKSGVLHEVDGDRICYAVGSPDRPVLRYKKKSK